MYDNKKLFTAIDATSGARLRNDDFGEQGQLWLELFPNPNRDVLARWIFQTGNFIEIKVVEFFPEWLECGLHISVVHHPAELCVARAFDGDFDFETVAMKTAALMGLMQIWEQVRRFELECFSKFHCK
jgi:hypothetical protein